MKTQCDVLIIGTGTAAYQVAHRCASAGLDVVTVDERAYGGTCARRGCQPKKFLVAAAEIVALSRQLTGQGITQPASLNWSDLMTHKRSFTDAVPARTERDFQQAGITTLYGRARFCGPDRVLVTGRDHGEVTADLVLHGAGRVPALEDLDLPAAGVKAGPEGVTVDSGQRSTTNPTVFAIGDAAAGSPPLAPAADHEGQVAAANIIAGKTVQTVDHSNEPSVVFTIPPLAAVGMDAAAASEAGIRVITNQADAGEWPTSQRIGQRHAYYKVILDADDRRILGAQVLGHGAGDVINLFALAIRQKMNADSLGQVLWAYPTVTSDIKHMLGNERGE